MTEARFWKSIRRSCSKLGWWAERVENTVSEGWPDVVVFTPSGRTIMLELKIAKGPNARIKVRPAQVVFAQSVEKLQTENIVFRFLALDELNRDQFWVLTSRNIGKAMESGVKMTRAKKYGIRTLDLNLRRWNGEKVHIQRPNSTPAEKPSWLEGLS